jgi:hypothetical protein
VILKFYFDEDSADRALIDSLRARGLEVSASMESGLFGADDEAQLSWCAQNGFVLVSHNVSDFYRLHSEFLTQGKLHQGIILMRQQSLGIGEKLRRLVRISHTRSSEEMRNRVEFLSHWGKALS